MNAILAIDSGGSKCDAMLVRDDGTVLGWGHVHEPGKSGRAFHAIYAAMKQAMVVDKFDRLVVSNISEVIPMSLTRLMTAQRLEFVAAGEVGAALAQAGVANGLVALAGTGAFVCGRNRAGQRLHYDGLGPWIGDFGSGHYLGVLALQAVMRSGWGPRYHTSLREAIFKLFKGSGEYDLVELRLYERDRSAVAQLARVVNQEAEAGDAIARRILRRGALALADTLGAVVTSLDMRHEPYPLVGIGSVLTRSDIYWNTFCRRALQIAPKLQPLRQEGQAVLGVALAGMAHMGLTDPAIRARLMASASTYEHYRRR